MIICLCGSTKFKTEFEQMNRDLTLQGHIVVAPGVFGHADGIILSKDTKTMLDDLHLDKIRLSDEVFIVNPGGYVGESTLKEIEFAKSLNKPVKFLVSPNDFNN